nr:hypothetical protein 6 [Elusimicrobiota bacterium]
MDQFINKIINGNALDVLKTIPDESVDCVVTSPPYWALRDYQTSHLIWDGDPNCQHDFSNETQIGDIRFRGKQANVYSNANPEIYVGDGKGSICSKCGAWQGELGLEPDFNLYIKHLNDIFIEVHRILKKTGTCWVNLGDTYGGSGQGWGKQGKTRGRNSIDTRPVDIMCTDKPPSYKIMPKCLLLIPCRFAIEMCNRDWILRNTIIWQKNNCMPSSVKDRFTVDFEYMFFFAKSKKYYFKQQVEDFAGSTFVRIQANNSAIKAEQYAGLSNDNKQRFSERVKSGELAGRNKRCVWKISTQSFTGAHFATFPEELIITPIKAGCPENGIVLDPFAGAGTTCMVAKKLGRKYIGIELNQQYAKMAEKRIENECGTLF